MKKEQFLEKTKNITDRQLIEGFKTEKAALLQNMTGKEDLFYCNWHTEDQDAIFEALDVMGTNDFLINIQATPVVNPEEI